jgi:hypothetical protein
VSGIVRALGVDNTVHVYSILKDTKMDITGGGGKNAPTQMPRRKERVRGSTLWQTKLRAG